MNYSTSQLSPMLFGRVVFYGGIMQTAAPPHTAVTQDLQETCLRGAPSSPQEQGIISESGSGIMAPSQNDSRGCDTASQIAGLSLPTRRRK